LYYYYYQVICRFIQVQVQVQVQVVEPDTRANHALIVQRVLSKQPQSHNIYAGLALRISRGGSTHAH
jgi:hypothetical protein